MNIIIGQQQLEALNQVISIVKTKNKDEKIEILKKTNIQKSVNWCEKFKIPYNKFSDKINIFLPIIKEEIDSSNDYNFIQNDIICEENNNIIDNFDDMLIQDENCII